MFEGGSNIIDIHTASLMKRLHSYFDELSIYARRWNDTFDPMFKFRSLNLIAEIYVYVSSFFSNRTRRLPDYFNECTLKQCLEWVVEVEELQQNLEKCIRKSNVIDDEEIDSLLKDDIKKVRGSSVIESFKLLYNNGIRELCKDSEGKEYPSVSKSLLWGARFYTDTTYSFKRVFRNAKEELEENGRGSMFSLAPEDKGYNEKIKNNLLSRHIAYRTVCQGSNPLRDEDNGYAFIDYIKSIYTEADKASIKDIHMDFFKALELLRNTFMTDAEDIYYIRTGDFESLKNVYDKETIEYFYTRLPFEQYYIARDSYMKDLEDEFTVKLEDWRDCKGCVCRKMTKEEYIEFLEDYKAEVENRMKEYEDLWRLRLHSGGLDSEVTSENFARMFYRRKGVNRYFIEFQWELEMIQDLIKKHRATRNEYSNDNDISPEQKAVETFVYKILQLVNKTYEEWNNKRVSPGANKPEVHIVIKREELIKFMQEKKTAYFDELKEICYPETGKSKSNFCKYVVQLQEKEYFGKLPNKELAKILAPIIGLSEGSVTNYLSRTQQ